MPNVFQCKIYSAINWDDISVFGSAYAECIANLRILLRFYDERVDTKYKSLNLNIIYSHGVPVIVFHSFIKKCLLLRIGRICSLIFIYVIFWRIHEKLFFQKSTIHFLRHVRILWIISRQECSVGTIHTYSIILYLKTVNELSR